ncbi:hypothetical protein TVAG_365760 [Trichomonas vaginalis G3]|uniref:C2 DOCK-type domain-containing protein n=1 Tax=Trichomonas vaginalis (strain ATCC PRA-98 / G3) TaxID=412133 RepID=A2DHM0_TRIV3|nr:memory T cell proliferation [Trichomonas vaginalis G3]EAY20068.1 hypothetical protein TVAG_365760 [Trichomonas vaginalis G3]KAI5528021.1 memory T cell proliferation [Trichomonas vaginalis G3]|eukprot:XP_001581054.1 hypothetical protein [Trichomonas vaginalis G3]
MGEVDLNVEIQEMVKNNAEYFRRLHLERKALAIAKVPSYWENEKIPPNIIGPAANFFNNPPLIINYVINNSRPKSIARSNPNTQLFVFDKNLSDELYSRPLDEILAQSAPLVSILSLADVHAFKDIRLTYSLPTFQYVPFTISFESLMCKFKIIEPLYFTLFLFDDTTFEQISETYIYPCNNDTCFLDTIPVPSPVFNIPVDKTSSVKIIVCLTRLLHKDGGEDFDNYYLNPSGVSTDKLHEICLNINHKNIFSIFGFSEISLPQVIAGNTLELTKFIKTSTVSVSFLENYFRYPLENEQTFPISVKLKITKVPYQQKGMYPYEYYTNHVNISLHNSFFTFPPGMRGRNLYCIVQVVHNGSVFSEYKSFCQYHVENPQFFDSFKLQLPPDLNNDSELVFKFFHAVVKGEVKDRSQDSGTASIKLFNNGLFLGDGRHTVGISYDGTPVKPTETNCFTFSTVLNSIVYTNSKTCQSIFSGNYNEIVLPGLNEILPIVYVITDNLLENIKEGKKGAFKMFLKLLKLFPKERSTNFMLYYVRNLALRGMTDFSSMFIKTWIKYTEHSFSTKRSDLHYSWILFELLVKSLAIDKPHTKLLLELLYKLTSYFPQFRDAQQNVGLDLNKSFSIFERDIFEFVDKNIVITIVSHHLKSLDVSQPYDASLFKNFFQNFFTPRTFTLFCLPLKNGDTLLNQVILPHLRALDPSKPIIEEVFKHIFSMLLTFEPEEQLLLTTGMVPLLEIVGNMTNMTRHKIIYSLTVCIFIVYNVEIKEFNDKVANFAELILRCSIVNTETAVSEDNDEEDSMRQWRSRKGSIFSIPADFEWDALSFCSQAICIKWCSQFSNLKIFNSILVPFSDVILALSLQSHYFRLLDEFAQNHFDLIFSPESNLKHVVRCIISTPTKKGINYLCSLYQLEQNKLGNNHIMNALTARALYLCPPFNGVVDLFTGTPFEEIVRNFNKSINVLSTTMKDATARIEARETIANLIAHSPDARVKALLSLSDEFEAFDLDYEATMAVIQAMGLVAYYTKDVFKNAIDVLEKITPSIRMEESNYIKENIRGIANSEYFCAFGFIKLANLALHLSTKVQRLHLKLSNALIPLYIENGLYKELSQILTNSIKDNSIETPIYQLNISDFFYIKSDNFDLIVHLTNPYPSEAALAIIREIFKIHILEIYIRALKQENPTTFYFYLSFKEKVYLKTAHPMPSYKISTPVKSIEKVTLSDSESQILNLKMKSAQIDDLVKQKDFLKLQKLLQEVLYPDPRKSLKVVDEFDKSIHNAVIAHGIWGADNPESIEKQFMYEAILKNSGIDI